MYYYYITALPQCIQMRPNTILKSLDKPIGRSTIWTSWWLGIFTKTKSIQSSSTPEINVVEVILVESEILGSKSQGLRGKSFSATLISKCVILYRETYSIVLSFKKTHVWHSGKYSINGQLLELFYSTDIFIYIYMHRYIIYTWRGNKNNE